jgi:hypothetical protein
MSSSSSSSSSSSYIVTNKINKFYEKFHVVMINKSHNMQINSIQQEINNIDTFSLEDFHEKFKTMNEIPFLTENNQDMFTHQSGNLAHIRKIYTYLLRMRICVLENTIRDNSNTRIHKYKKAKKENIFTEYMDMDARSRAQLQANRKAKAQAIIEEQAIADTETNAQVEAIAEEQIRSNAEINAKVKAMIEEQTKANTEAQTKMKAMINKQTKLKAKAKAKADTILSGLEQLEEPIAQVALAEDNFQIIEHPATKKRSNSSQGPLLQPSSPKVPKIEVVSESTALSLLATASETIDLTKDNL